MCDSSRAIHMKVFLSVSITPFFAVSLEFIICEHVMQHSQPFSHSRNIFILHYERKPFFTLTVSATVIRRREWSFSNDITGKIYREIVEPFADDLS